jgi:hypothetical protein
MTVAFRVILRCTWTAATMGEMKMVSGIDGLLNGLMRVSQVHGFLLPFLPRYHLPTSNSSHQQPIGRGEGYEERHQT